MSNDGYDAVAEGQAVLDKYSQPVAPAPAPQPVAPAPAPATDGEGSVLKAFGKIFGDTLSRFDDKPKLNYTPGPTPEEMSGDQNMTPLDPSELVSRPTPEQDAQYEKDKKRLAYIAKVRAAARRGGGKPYVHPDYKDIPSLDKQRSAMYKRLEELDEKLSPDTGTEGGKWDEHLDKKLSEIAAAGLPWEKTQEAIAKVRAEFDTSQADMAKERAELSEAIKRHEVDFKSYTVEEPIGRMDDIGEQTIELQKRDMLNKEALREVDDVTATRQLALMETAKRNLTNIDKEFEEKWGDQQKAIQKQKDDYEAQLERVRGMKPVTMSSYFDEHPGGMVLAGFAMLLSVSPLTQGASKIAMSLINKGLESEIRAQEMAIDVGKWVAGSKINLVNMERTRLNDDVRAHESARDMLRELLASDMEMGELRGLLDRSGAIGQQFKDDWDAETRLMETKKHDKLRTQWEIDKAAATKLHQQRRAATQAQANANMLTILGHQGYVDYDEDHGEPIYDPDTGEVMGLLPATGEHVKGYADKIRESTSTLRAEQKALTDAIEYFQPGLGRFANSARALAARQLLEMKLHKYVYEITGAQGSEAQAARIRQAMSGKDPGSWGILEEMVDSGLIAKSLDRFNKERAREHMLLLGGYGYRPAHGVFVDDPKKPGVKKLVIREGYVRPQATLKDKRDGPAPKRTTSGERAGGATKHYNPSQKRTGTDPRVGNESAWRNRGGR